MELLSLFFPLILAFFIVIFGRKIFAKMIVYFLNILNEFTNKKGDL